MNFNVPRVDKLREARETLMEVRFNTGNDHSGYSDLEQLIQSIYCLETSLDWSYR